MYIQYPGTLENPGYVNVSEPTALPSPHGLLYQMQYVPIHKSAIHSLGLRGRNAPWEGPQEPSPERPRVDHGWHWFQGM